MSRLTDKEIKIKYSDTTKYDLLDHKMFNKLSDLEDIEEEGGVELITIYKALFYGFYDKVFNRFDSGNNSLVYQNGKWYISHFGFMLELKKYGKTWALTKEELEEK